MAFKRTLRCLAAVVVSGVPVAMSAAPAIASTGLTCDYSFVAWSGGFSANLTISNGGPTVSGWTARWSLTVPTALGSVWSASMSHPDPEHLLATNVSYNAVIPAGRSVAFGWTAKANSTSRPIDITVNGAPC